MVMDDEDNLLKFPKSNMVDSDLLKLLAPAMRYLKKIDFEKS